MEMPGDPSLKAYFTDRATSSAKERTVRVRTAGEKGFLTVKGITNGVTRSEFEYEIPFADADEMLSGLAEKTVDRKAPLQDPRRFIGVGD